jgi:hypothetical protein
MAFRLQNIVLFVIFNVLGVDWSLWVSMVIGKFDQVSFFFFFFGGGGGILVFLDHLLQDGL